MGRKYKIYDQESLYFVTFTIVNWMDLFIRDCYKQIFVESICYCQKEKGLEVSAWCIMTSHIHMIIGRNGILKIEDIIRDMKSFTSGKIRKCIEESKEESRKEWMLWMFERAGQHNVRNNKWQLWQQHSHPIHLSNFEMMKQRLNYIHENPVNAGFVSAPEDWKWSSARDYSQSGYRGMIDLVLIE